MKKLLSVLSTIMISSTSTLTVACDPIVSIASKSYTGETKDINIFFEDNDTIKPYDLRYLRFINDSWEHYGFESSLSSNKVDKHKTNIDENNKFLEILIDIYKPTRDGNNLDFTGMTIVIENIFLNSIVVVRDKDGNYSTQIESELAITIKKGWKETGKVLATVKNINPLDKNRTFDFINRIMMGIEPSIIVSEERNKYGDFEIQGNISKDMQDRFSNKLITSANSKLSLDLTGLVSFNEEENSMTIDGQKYIFKD
ncbi:hypothetical protein [Spiroplasma endosymbiont of Diplazon laetatorius]|uniref:hypothetical protein n=1 Tax=Spiroplasma endosymbiont of Diplazon laetatorius TaxID=3066322 RepID=UPI0030CFCFBE